MWSLRVRGSAFLWHQVRCMAAILLMLGKKQEAPTVSYCDATSSLTLPDVHQLLHALGWVGAQVVDDLLDLALWPAKPQYAMAHEAPLVLHSCAYQ